MDLYKQLGEALNPTNHGIGSGVAIGSDISFKAGSITQASLIRRQFATFEKSVQVNIRAFLAMATVEQMEAIVFKHKNVAMVKPFRQQKTSLQGIIKIGSGKFIISLSCGDFEVGDLYFDDALMLLETIEGVITP